MDLPLGHAASTGSKTLITGFAEHAQNIHTVAFSANQQVRSSLPVLIPGSTHRYLPENTIAEQDKLHPAFSIRTSSTNSILLGHFSALFYSATTLKITAIRLSSAENGMILLQLRSVKTTKKAKMHKKEKISKHSEADHYKLFLANKQ